jgi:hypothetical protein
MVAPIIRKPRPPFWPVHPIELIATLDHPFWVSNEGRWVEAENLRLGDKLWLTETTAVITGLLLDTAPVGETFITYNFAVTDFHTYFVAPIGNNLDPQAVWVHNNDCPKGGIVKGNSPEIDPGEIMGKTPDEIETISLGKGLVPKGPDPKTGRGAYNDRVTGQQRVLVHPNTDCPHCHVNNAQGQRLHSKGRVVPPESPNAYLPLNLEKE